ncbi:hypothetical protein MRB53_013893 [Persea americana]|uniref:Uncharacterized protein n=1 Tax=Persea americana TaxID=3435 RepID=A0ACC2K9P1_PERAE|nr:hypothetical protein MRB53_013893 [Persea americana]
MVWGEENVILINLSVTYKYLSSFNGRILNQVNVEDQESSGYYLQLLQEHDGVVISSTSLASDTKALAFNKTSANQPLLIIIATVSDSPLHLPALTVEVAPHAIIFADKNVTVDPTTELDLRRWVTEIVVLDQMNLGPILDFCGGQGLYSILIDLKEDSSAYHEILEMGLKEGLLQKIAVSRGEEQARDVGERERESSERRGRGKEGESSVEGEGKREKRAARGRERERSESRSEWRVSGKGREARARVSGERSESRSEWRVRGKGRAVKPGAPERVEGERDKRAVKQEHQSERAGNRSIEVRL